MRTRITTMACVACIATALLTREVPAAEATFLAAVVGGEETPRNESTTMGKAVVTMSPDGSLTYSVATAGFETKFLSAYVHEGPAGAVGPVLFGLACNPDGTSCSGTSPPLDAAEKVSIAERNTYVNLCTEAFPEGEIRGQLVPVTRAAEVDVPEIDNFMGKASHVGMITASGSPRSGEVRISGGFRVGRGLDLRVSNAVIQDLLNETGGTGELVRGDGGGPALPIPLHLAHYHPKKEQATYKSIGGGLRSGCRLKIRRRGPQVFKFSLRCKGANEPTIPVPPQLCTEGPRPATDLMTSILVNAVEPVVVTTLQPWQCLRNLLRAGGSKAMGGAKKSRRTTQAKTCGDGSNRAPVADFRADPRRGYVPLSVAFTNRSVDRDGEVVGFTWDFGDGSGITEESPTHTYTRAGQFVVTLMVTDDQGITSEPKRETITVSGNRSPVADFVAAPRKGNEPLKVTFTSTSSDPDGDVVGFSWDFGDGGGSVEEHPTHTYTGAGDFVVTLTVTDDRGMSSEPKRETITVKGNRRPLADFLTSPRSGNEPLKVTFTSLSSDPDGDVVAFGWNFGDGSGSIEENPIHTYARAGEFVVTLMVTDNRGLTSEVKRDTVSVRGGRVTGEGGGLGDETAPEPLGNNRPPRADFRMNPTRGPWPLTVTFTNNSWDPDGDGLAVRWSFGDGGASNEWNPTHTYTSAGQLIVTLTATDDRGLTAEPKRETISVEANRPPRVDFRAEPVRGHAPLTVTFTNRTSDPDDEELTFGWSFGDGSGSIEENPTHTYTRAGEFVVTLIAADGRGLTSEVKRQTVSVKVNRPPRPDFLADPRRGEAPLTVTFANRSSDPEGDGMSFTWDFGDGTRGIETNPRHTYARTGTFEVTLTATDYSGARSEQPKRETIVVMVVDE